MYLFIDLHIPLSDISPARGLALALCFFFRPFTAQQRGQAAFNEDAQTFVYRMGTAQKWQQSLFLYAHGYQNIVKAFMGGVYAEPFFKDGGGPFSVAGLQVYAPEVKVEIGPFKVYLDGLCAEGGSLADTAPLDSRTEAVVRHILGIGFICREGTLKGFRGKLQVIASKVLQAEPELCRRVGGRRGGSGPWRGLFSFDRPVFRLYRRFVS